MRPPVPLILLALAATAVPAPAQTWRVGDRSAHVIARDLDPRGASGRAALLLRVERAAAGLCRHEPLATDRHACVAAAVADTSRRSPALRLALSERDGSALAAR